MSGDPQRLAPVGRSRSLRNRALENVRRWLAEANLAPGQFLPSEHELAARMNIARSTLRLALQELEDEGLFQTVHGKGRIVTASADSIAARTVWVLSHFSQTAALADYSTTGFSEFIQAGVLEALQAEGLHATVLHPGHIAARHLGASRGDRPRGMILFPLALRWAKGCEILRALESARVPIVTFERSASWGENFDAVMPDHETGCYELVRWLIAKGHRRIVRF
jgi:DNA-binding transcriptional regulator YhcF (GntR family)